MEKNVHEWAHRSSAGISFFYRYLIYHHKLFRLWIYTNKLINPNGCPRAYPLVFSLQALVINSNYFVTLDVLRSRDPELISCRKLG